MFNPAINEGEQIKDKKSWGRVSRPQVFKDKKRAVTLKRGVRSKVDRLKGTLNSIWLVFVFFVNIAQKHFVVKQH